ncbi:MAG: hypothetical protein ACK4RM_02785 [Flavobacterium sp.]
MNRKHIDRVFQEKFKDFYVEPPLNSWAQIENKLNSEKGVIAKKSITSKKIILYVASLILIVSSLFLLKYRTTLSTSDEDTNINFENINIKNEHSLGKESNDKPSGYNSITVDEYNNTLKLLKKPSNKQNQEIIKHIKTSPISSIILTINESETDYKETTLDKKNYSLKPSMNILTLVNSNLQHNSNEGMAVRIVELTGINFNKNIFSEHINQNFTSISEDYANIVDEQLNDGDKLLIEEEEETTSFSFEEKEINRWQLTPTIAPVYFSSLGEGSPIDERFIDSEKSFAVTNSVGVGVTYNLSRKISLRSGLHRLNLSYTTNDVVFFADINSGSYSTIDYDKERSPMFFDNAHNYNQPQDVNNVSSNTGNLEQNFSFLELPMELQYFLINKKFGVKAIGGISTFFLLNNSVNIVSNNLRTQVGIANNVNPVHFSTNIGLGFDYQFLKSFRASVEPMFKYQLNTFSNSSGNFRPYFIGVYSGISYQF